MRRSVVAVVTLVVVLARVAGAAGADTPPAPAADPAAESDAAVLADAGIAPDGAGALGHVRGVLPTAEARRVVSDLLARLGSEVYLEREEATRRLANLPFVPADVLREAATSSPDLEVRARAQQVLQQREDGPGGDVLRAALRTVGRHKPTGAAEALLQLAPLLGDETMSGTLRDALAAAARPEDAGRLRAALADPRAAARAAAVAAALATAGEAARPDVRALLADKDDDVRLAAALALGDTGERAALPVLANLLNAAHPRVRARAAATLRALTGQELDFAAHDEPGARVAAADAWRDWVTRNGATAELRFPVPRVPPELGRTLICIYAQNKVVELDAKDRETFSVTLTGPWGCVGLPNGHRLIASYGTQAVVEFDARGRECWRRDKLPGNPISVERLENGNTLVALSDGNRVVEVRRDGELAWDVQIGGRPTSAQRLPNGRTLIALDSARRIVEVDRSGKEVWQLELSTEPSTAMRLDNGNTLVSERGLGRVVEYDRAGRVAWRREGLQYAVDAQRLRDGTTLYADGQGVRQVGRDGKVLWEKLLGSTRMHRY